MMRKIFACEFMTLDGVIQNEDEGDGFKHGGWFFGYADEPTGAVIQERLAKPVDLLSERKTFAACETYLANVMNHQLQPIASRAKVVVLLLLLCSFSQAQLTTPISALEVKYRKRILKNDRVSVYLLEIPTGHASLMHRHDTDILSIFVAGGETRGTIYGKPPREDRFAIGEVRFRPAGFTHSTENIGANVFRSVILEFNSSMGAIEPSPKPPDSRYCNPGSETACVDEKYLLCTAGFCVKEISVTPGAIWLNADYASDQMLIAVSDYRFSFQQKGKAARGRRRKSGDVEYVRRSSARHWKNTLSVEAHIIDVVFR